MPVTITFYSIKEKQPHHGEDIIWLSKTSSYGYDGFEPRDIQAEYSWECVDKHGCSNGTSACFDPDTESGYKLGEIVKIQGNLWKLQVLFDGWVADGNDLWIGVEDYWKYFEEVEEE